MARVTDAQVEELRPFLVGEGPGSDDEWDMFCPLHADATRSARINMIKGTWYCHRGCGGGRVSTLVSNRDRWRNGTEMETETEGTHEAGTGMEGVDIERWHRELVTRPGVLDDLQSHRRLTRDTLETYVIGWDPAQEAYTIPVFHEGKLANVRFYQLRPRNSRRKIWSIKGQPTALLYPESVLDSDPRELIVCEGEWDALATIQEGFPAITRTGSATTWKTEWNPRFAGRKVWLAHDCDDAGVDGNRKVGRSLRRIAAEIRVLRLPFPIVPKGGKDLTDYWLEGGTAKELQTLLTDAEPWESAPKVRMVDATLPDAFRASNVGETLRLTVSIAGRRNPGWDLPAAATLSCTRDAGPQCKACPLMATGEDSIDLDYRDPGMLKLIEANEKERKEVIREAYGALKCNRLEVAIDRYADAEQIMVRTPVESMNGLLPDFRDLTVYAIGEQSTFPNSTVQIIGSPYPHPRDSSSVLLAWDVAAVETSLDRYELNQPDIELMKVFRPGTEETSLAKLTDIADDLASHVTNIYGRPQMHMAMDLVWHSILAWKFDGKREPRGWLELMIVGDTRTGKSEAATRMVQHYGLGELISCESSSYAGIVGGVQQYGDAWMVTWGALPMNDRRLVVLDEVSGLTVEQIGQMSSVRSSGIAEIAKIKRERAQARTRLIWLGNPRDKRMSDFTYGVNALRPLIGRNEDIARFDLAMSVGSDEVSGDVLHTRPSPGAPRYPREAAHALLRWCWSRKEDDVTWDDDATALVYRRASWLADRYLEDPPLVQRANSRLKVARTAVAIAARLFSTDRTYERVRVRAEHVRAATRFIDQLYSMQGFGYRQWSGVRLEERKLAGQHRESVRTYLQGFPTFSRYLRSSPEGKFKRQDLEEVLGIDRDGASAMINYLHDSGMVHKEAGFVLVSPELHEILREETS